EMIRQIAYFNLIFLSHYAANSCCTKLQKNGQLHGLLPAVFLKQTHSCFYTKGNFPLQYERFLSLFDYHYLCKKYFENEK
ncbi:MAG: hypothetical protein ACP5D9_18820, partial [Mariniphaga sp.]